MVSIRMLLEKPGPNPVGKNRVLEQRILTRIALCQRRPFAPLFPGETDGNTVGGIPLKRVAYGLALAAGLAGASDSVVAAGAEVAAEVLVASDLSVLGAGEAF